MISRRSGINHCNRLHQPHKVTKLSYKSQEREAQSKIGNANGFQERLKVARQTVSRKPLRSVEWHVADPHKLQLLRYGELQNFQCWFTVNKYRLNNSLVTFHQRVAKIHYSQMYQYSETNISINTTQP